jgi:hypothetical protein
MKRKHETINGHNISCWDDGESVVDRYTVVFLDEIDDQGKVGYLAMSSNPFHPQGFCQHGDMMIGDVAYKGRGGAFTKRIKFSDLPPDCQKAVQQDLNFEA